MNITNLEHERKITINLQEGSKTGIVRAYTVPHIVVLDPKPRPNHVTFLDLKKTIRLLVDLKLATLHCETHRSLI